MQVLQDYSFLILPGISYLESPTSTFKTSWKLGGFQLTPHFIPFHPPTPSPLTDSETFRELSSSAFFSREQTHSLRFCLQRDAAALFLSRKRCLRSSGSSSVVRRRRPPVGCAGDTWRERRGRGQKETDRQARGRREKDKTEKGSMSQSFII